MDDLTKKLLRRLAETVLEVLRDDAPKHKPADVYPAVKPQNPAGLPDAQAAAKPALREGMAVRVWDGNKWVVAVVEGVVAKGKDKGKVRAHVERPGKRNRRMVLDARSVYPIEGGK